MTAKFIEQVAPDQLVPYERNARTHSSKQIRMIAKSIQRFGFLNPVLSTADNRIIAGHGRVEAAKSLGLAEVPVLRIEGLSPDEIRAYVIADNQLALKAGWDKEVLAIELQHLTTIDFDIEVIGFETAEIDLILDAEAGKADDPGREDDVPAPDAGPAVSRDGDLWLFGLNRSGFAGGSNLQIGWSHDEQNDEQVFTRSPRPCRADGYGSRR